MSETLSAVFANLTLTFEDWSRQRTSKDMRSLKKKKVQEFTSGTYQQIRALTSYILNVVMDEKECATGIRRDLCRLFKHVVARFCIGIRECFCTAYILHNLKAIINYLHRIKWH